MEYIVKAGAEDFIWLIAGAFWIIAQIAGAAAKKKAAPTFRENPQGEPRHRPTPDSQEPPEDLFAELMRQLGGGATFEQPEPEETPSFEEQNPWKPGEIEELPDIQPIQRIEIPEPPMPEKIDVAVEELDIRPTMRSFKTALPFMKLPSMTMSFQTSEKNQYGVPDIAKIIDPADRKSLRRAILGQIILNPPKALKN